MQLSRFSGVKFIASKTVKILTNIMLKNTCCFGSQDHVTAPILSLYVARSKNKEGSSGIKLVETKCTTAEIKSQYVPRFWPLIFLFLPEINSQYICDKWLLFLFLPACFFYWSSRHQMQLHAFLISTQPTLRQVSCRHISKFCFKNDL